MISGKTVELRPASMDDAEFLFSLRNNIDLQGQLLSRPKPNTEKNVRDWFDKKTNSSDSVFFVVSAKNGEKIFGFIQIANIDLVSGWGYLGVCLDSSSRGQGIGAEAISLLEDYAKKVLALRKIILEVIADNEIAIGLYKKLGYKDVGIFERHYYFNEYFHDTVVMEKFI